MTSNLSAFGKAMGDLPEQEEEMPVIFIGHGSPMNALEQNEWSLKWQELGRTLPRPKAIVCISAHWLTRGTYVTAMPQPRTIHDFGGFPRELFEMEYPAPGAPGLAEEVRAAVQSAQVGSDKDWGLDHGTWSVLAQMYPKADIPVIQFSIDYHKPPEYHYQLAKELRFLRKKGVLVLGSGNIVHNLGMINMSGAAYDWAIDFDERVTSFLERGDHQGIIDYQSLGRAALLSVPTPDHYYPLLYAAGLAGVRNQVSFPTTGVSLGSASMRSVLFES
ncbi:MAG: 4,5-DOPA dioxygenase extradiol [Bacteroidia bacterium]|nr:4,5-DOPA dioxygenase extradiol [Bacteroidia bacterium]